MRSSATKVAVVLVGVMSIASCGSDDTSAPATLVAPTSESPPAESTETSTTAPTVPTSPAPSDAAASSGPATTDPGSSDTSVADSTETTEAETQPFADRSFDIQVPASYRSSTPAPLLIVLHGYTSTGALQELYFGMGPLADQRGFLYVHPNGTTDSRGRQFWNATDACCNLYGATGVDDSAYLMSVIDQVSQQYSVDPKRIYLAGHSNGGFMSYRMACEHADTIAAIVSLAGATYDVTAACSPSEPVSVAQIHGTADSVIQFGGGEILGNEYPSADKTVSTWAQYNRCSTTLEHTGRALDLERQMDGPESSVGAFAGCPPGIAVELWTVPDGAHAPAISSTFSSAVLDFLEAHPKP